MPSNPVDVWVYSDSPIVIAGQVDCPLGRRFSDVINSIEGDYLALEQSSCFPLGEPISSPIGTGQAVYVFRNRIAFLLRGPESAEELASRPLTMVQNLRHRVAFQVGNWLIGANLSLPRSRPVEIGLAINTGGTPFLPVTSARAIYAPRREIRLEAELLLINRALIASYWPYGLVEISPSAVRG